MLLWLTHSSQPSSLPSSGTDLSGPGVLPAPSHRWAFAPAVSSACLDLPFSVCLDNACFSPSCQLSRPTCGSFGKTVSFLLLVSQVLTESLGRGGGSSLIGPHQVICPLVTGVRGQGTAGLSQPICWGRRGFTPGEGSCCSWQTELSLSITMRCVSKDSHPRSHMRTTCGG